MGRGRHRRKPSPFWQWEDTELTERPGKLNLWAPLEPYVTLLALIGAALFLVRSCT